jgi:Peptidase family S41
MMKFSLLFILFVQSFISYSQNCSCLDEFNFIKNHIEKNNGGFNKKIKSPEEPAYKKFTDDLKKEITVLKDNKYCIAYLKKYILYLQDHHSNITSGPGISVKEDSEAAVKAFLNSPDYLSTEIIIIDSSKIAERFNNRPLNSIEGLYQTPDKAYTVALIKNKTKYRDYAAVILNSKTSLWTRGQVKFELKQLNDSLFEAFISLRNHSLNYEQINFKNGQLQLNGWNKINAISSSTPGNIDNDLIKFTILDSSTTLLSIRSFDAALFSKLDSAYKKVIPVIKKYPTLIIDVRNNGGGSDWSYNALMPLIYTDPFESDVVEYYSTPDNIKAYQAYDDKLQKNNPPGRPVFSSGIAAMKKADPYTFVPMGNGNPVKVAYSKNEGYPTKIAVLYNRFCASSCESLLFEVMHSSKTIMVGENSGGYTGYGNVMTITTPCGNQLFWTTTVYRNQWKYEFVGIPPQYRISEDEKDWVDYTRRLLEEK